MSFSIFDNLESGNDSVAFKRQASRNSIASATHLVQRDFGKYLMNAADKVEFNERLGYVIGDISDIVERTASFEAIPEVIKVLTWNFDKKKGDDDDSDSKDDDKDSDDAGSDDADDDSDSSDDDDDSDDDSTPDFVDTDKDDDKDRDDKKESRKQAESLPSEQEGFVGLLDDWPLEANPVSKDFDGDVNELEPAGFNAVGSTGFPIVARNVKAIGNYGDDGYRGMGDPFNAPQLDKSYKGYSDEPQEPLTHNIGDQGTVPGTFPGGYKDPLEGIDPTLPKGTFNSDPNFAENYDKEFERQNRAPVIAPGHVARVLPFVPRNASRPKA